ncbi:MAG: transporter [Candidatus Dadabacteria bacterium]|nr:MAG: transporter [Candidatus Dadabacteria bacterium]
MSESLQTVLTYILIPVVVTIIGGIIAAYRSPGGKTRITVQHFAAGVVFAAVAIELLPELVTNMQLLPLIIGFSSGVALMLVVRWGSEKFEGGQGSGSFVIAAGVDVFIDGLLMGVSFDVGIKEGIIITVALSIELLFLALSVSSNLANEGKSKLRIIATAIILSLLVLVGATLGGTLLEGIHRTGIDVIIAFAVAALLYLVTEELLVEAHRGEQDSAFSTTMFFVGFLIVIILETATI